MPSTRTSPVNPAGSIARIAVAWTAEEENARLAAIVTSSPDAIISFAAEDGRIKTWNPAAVRLFGYSEEEAVGATVALILPPRDRLTSQEDGTGVFGWVMRAGPIQVESVRRRKDGTLIDVAITAAPMLAPDGRALGVSAVFRDIGEHKRMQARLEESEAFLRSVLDASTDCIKVVEADGTLSYMNPNGLCAMEIDDFSAVKGAEWACLWPDESAGQVREAIEAVRTAAGTRFEAFCPTAKGTPRWWDVSVAPIRDARGEVQRIVSVSRDITTRKHAEDALATSEAQLRDLLATVDLGAFMARDLDGVIRFWSEGCARLYGWTAAEAVGRSAHDLLRTEFAIPLAEIEAALERDGEWTGDLRHRTKAGATMIVSAHKVARRDAQGRLIAVLETLTDVTALRQAERGRQLLVQELNHRVKNLFTIAIGMVTMTARRAASAAEMAQALVGRLMALARSHELIRPAITGTDHQIEAATLRELVETVIAPHLSADSDPLRIHGPDVRIGPNAATGLALVLHELATNAAKYGALSVPDGRLDVEWRDEGETLAFTWTERGGPQIDSPPKRSGFGSQLARTSAGGQLGGAIVYDWNPAGLRVALTCAVDKLQH